MDKKQQVYKGSFKDTGKNVKDTKGKMTGTSFEKGGLKEKGTKFEQPEKLKRSASIGERVFSSLDQTFLKISTYNGKKYDHPEPAPDDEWM